MVSLARASTSDVTVSAATTDLKYRQRHGNDNRSDQCANGVDPPGGRYPSTMSRLHTTIGHAGCVRDGVVDVVLLVYAGEQGCAGTPGVDLNVLTPVAGVQARYQRVLDELGVGWRGGRNGRVTGQ